ncbi:MAG TPA: class I fructose-bisphosphate aldolase [Pseudonocardiaceae bacterium]|nr:class I fructose-bisphosphate aldolase [Pseudonocardiaceae bacterium]
MDHLRARLACHVDRGARFATWRAVLRIGPGLPIERALRANAHALARYAVLGPGGRSRSDRGARSVHRGRRCLTSPRPWRAPGRLIQCRGLRRGRSGGVAPRHR